MATQYTFQEGRSYMAHTAYSNEVAWLFKAVRRTARTVWLQDEDSNVRGYRIQHISTTKGSDIEVVHHRLFGNILARDITNA